MLHYRVDFDAARARAPYLNDVIHCEHVIDHLLAPAVEKAGFDPIKPKAKGANLIHAEIVRNLQTAALVLCDMSGLNPNVLFELGIRTAMNKPICLVIDEVTKDAPFDLESVNHHEYVSDLNPWVLPAEVDKLAAHIGESFSEKENALWKHFALRLTADATARPLGPDDKIDLLLSEVGALRRQVTGTELALKRDRLTRDIPAEVVSHIQRTNGVQNLLVLARDLGLNLWQYTDNNGVLTLVIDPEDVDITSVARLTSRATSFGIEVSVVFSPMGIQPEDPKLTIAPAPRVG